MPQNVINHLQNQSQLELVQAQIKHNQKLMDLCNNYSNIKLLHIIYMQTPFKNAFKYKTAISNEDLLNFFK